MSYMIFTTFSVLISIFDGPLFYAVNEMLLDNSKPPWKHVFSNTILLLPQVVNIRNQERNYRANGYKDYIKFKTEQTKNTEHRKIHFFLQNIT